LVERFNEVIGVSLASLKNEGGEEFLQKTVWSFVGSLSWADTAWWQNSGCTDMHFNWLTALLAYLM